MTTHRTGFVWDERYGWHDTGTFAGGLPSGGFLQPYLHFDSPESKLRLAQLVAVSGLGARVHHLAPRRRSGRSVYVPFCGLAVMEVLSGFDTGVGDPFAPLVDGMAGHDLEDHQRAAVDRAAVLVAQIPVAQPAG